MVVILSCGVAILPILIYFAIKKFTGSKSDFSGRQSFALPEIPTAVEESEYEECSHRPEQIVQPYIQSCSNKPTYAECDMNEIPSCQYSTTLNDVTQFKLFHEKDMRKSKTIKSGTLYIRWTGTVAFTHDKVKRVVYTAVTDKALASNIVHWDKFLKRLVQLPKSKHLLRIAGIGIDNGRQYLIHERLFRGSLAAYIKPASENTANSYKPFLPAHIIRIVLGILEGMEHIHSAGFLHPGLSTKKVLLNYQGVGKLYDFYLSEDAVNILTIKKPEMNYSLNELAPEGIRRHEYSAASDVWSTAVLIWQMLSDGSLPFRHDNDVNLDAETIPILPQTWPTKFEYLRNCRLFDCWNTNESDRPTINELKRSIQRNPDVDTYNIPKTHGGSMAGYYMPMKKSVIDNDT
ncbi:Tyrosine-protein kinase CSK [Holothuria leucospilota]|uniref:Tyrosine-protein kinase CSK n=1 Tax=Holothuria leucospilota TaxID=206669 RepID=A0A9Q0YER9_HOLLE|nr:Tyrosine-protein kinase CSK [Holothuria leucospilota]